MASNSGGQDVRNQGRRGHEVLNGRALSASHIKPSEKFAEKEKSGGRCKDGGCAEKDCENNKAKKCDIFFKPTSYGGCEGQKDLQTEKVAEKLALLDVCRPKLLEKVAYFADADQNNNFDIENSLENKGTDRLNLSNDAQFRENVEIFRRAFGSNHLLKPAVRAFLAKMMVLVH